jgi:hypothetical protein
MEFSRYSQAPVGVTDELIKEFQDQKKAS